MFCPADHFRPALTGYKWLSEVLRNINRRSKKATLTPELFRQYVRHGHPLMKGARKDPDHPRYWIVPEHKEREIIDHSLGQEIYIGQKEMAELIGCSRTTVFDWLDNGTIPSVRTSFGRTRVLRQQFLYLLPKLRFKCSRDESVLSEEEAAKVRNEKQRIHNARNARKAMLKRRARRRAKASILAGLRKELQASRVGIKFEGKQPRDEAVIIRELNRIQMYLNEGET